MAKMSFALKNSMAKLSKNDNPIVVNLNYLLPVNISADYYSSSWYFVYFAFLFIRITFAILLSKFRAKFKIIFYCCRRPAHAVVWIIKCVVIKERVIKLSIIH
jgi:hypothetical protein